MNIKIKHIGNAKGTIGWLAASIDYVQIGESKGGKRGAWLILKDQTQICLVLHNPYDAAPEHGECDRLEILKRNNDPFIGLDICVTDACWESIETLAEAVRDEMRRIESEEKPIKFSVAQIV
jgi:hypothetical protein